MRKTTCSKPNCQNSLFSSAKRYCKFHHAEYMRNWRKTHPLTPEQKYKDNARSYAGVYLRRGHIERHPCRDCAGEQAEMHHKDYGKPTEVIWLCRKCHLAEHAKAA